MRRHMGYVLIIDPDAPTIERDFVKCQHCQRGIELKPGTDARVYLIPDGTGYREVAGCFCRKCFGPICPACDDKGTCAPWREALEREEARARLFKAVGIIQP